MRHVLLLLLVLALLLAGCDAQPEPAETTQPTISATEPTEPTEPAAEESPLVHPFPDLGFTLSFPEPWLDRFTLSRSGDRVTVIVDGVRIFTVTSVPNAPGARQAVNTLTEEGFIFMWDNYAHSLMYQLHGELPKDLRYIGVDRIYDGVNYSKYQVEGIPGMTAEDEILRAQWETATGSWEYINYRLGIAFTLPEDFLNRSRLNTRREGVSWCGIIGQKDNYQLGAFLASDGSTGFELYIAFLEDYPEITLVDGIYYGAICEWGPPREHSVFVCTSYHPWRYYTQEEKNAFTDEEIQAVLDTFRILTREEME